MKFCFFFFILGATMFKSSSSLSCFQCNGLEGIGPQDCFNTINISSADCSPEDNYCATVNYISSERSTINRFCSSSSVDDCDNIPEIQLPQNKQNCEVRFCKTDGCNSSTKMNYNLFLLMIATIASCCHGYSVL